jgi:hypothetical protein
MRISKGAKRLAVVASVAATMIVMAASPAAAASITISSLGFEIGKGYVLQAGRLYVACDLKADGNGVRTEVRLSNGFSDSVGDGNGAQTGCGEERPAGQAYVTSFRVCAAASYCSAWKDA